MTDPSVPAAPAAVAELIARLDQAANFAIQRMLDDKQADRFVDAVVDDRHAEEVVKWASASYASTCRRDVLDRREAASLLSQQAEQVETLRKELRAANQLRRVREKDLALDDADQEALVNAYEAIEAQNTALVKRAEQAESQSETLRKERDDIERLRSQAVEISTMLAEAGVGSCTLPEGVHALQARAEQAESSLRSMREALQHAKHPAGCPKGVGVGWYRPAFDAVCNCGIDAALARSSGDTKA